MQYLKALRKLKANNKENLKELAILLINKEKLVNTYNLNLDLLFLTSYINFS